MNKTYKVTIVEDEVSIRELYAFKFRNDGFEVSTAANGEDGLKIIEAEHPDIVLLDLMMPIMDGSRMLEKLRREEWGANIRVLILTNISKNEAPHALRFLHVDRYIVKAHHTPSQVVQIVREVLTS
jgi:two-component system response regulator AdeR